MEQIEIIEFPKEDYEPLVDYETWRVAVLRYCENLDPDKIKTMQKHNETDEVFVLLSGQCILYCAGSEEAPGEIQAISMEPMKLYNIKKGVWHNHTMPEGGTVLIVENQNTNDDNSPVLPLTEEQMQQVQKLHHLFC